MDLPPPTIEELARSMRAVGRAAAACGAALGGRAMNVATEADNLRRAMARVGAHKYNSHVYLLQTSGGRQTICFLPGCPSQAIRGSMTGDNEPLIFGTRCAAQAAAHEWNSTPEVQHHPGWKVCPVQARAAQAAALAELQRQASALDSEDFEEFH